MSLKTYKSTQIDLAREQRLQNADKLINVLKDIISSPKFIEAKQSDNTQLSEIAERVCTDIDYFTYKI